MKIKRVIKPQTLSNKSIPTFIQKIEINFQKQVLMYHPICFVQICGIRE